MESVRDYFKILYDSNKYLIKIGNTIDNSWYIYIFKNQHIQLDIQTSNTLTSTHIDIDKVVEYIENQNSGIKISYTCYYDDFEAYKKTIQDILEKIRDYYATRRKIIHIKYKVYWN